MLTRTLPLLTVLLSTLVFLAPQPAVAAEPSVLQPADAMRPPAPDSVAGAPVSPNPEDRAAAKTDAATSPEDAKKKLETRVTGDRGFEEEEAVGSYGQPRWTARRRFPTTRLYVIPAGVAIFEYWQEVKTPFSDPADTRLRSLFEFEIGLGHRLQLDFYLRLEQDGPTPMQLESERLELRYAFADWGKAWGNPTLYLEWIRPTNGPHWGEVKLLLGGEIVSRWYWGANISYERQFGDTQEAEYTITGAFSWAAIDSKLSIGAEAQIELVDNRARRFGFTGVELLVGPSLQWRPIRSAHIDLAWLIGPEWGRPAANAPFAVLAVNQPTVVIGYMF